MDSGKILTLEELVQIPNRLSFLDTAKVKVCRDYLTQNKDVEFLPVNIIESYLPEKDGKLSADKYAYRMYKVVMFGILKSGEKVTVVLNGIMPFFEIRVPKGVNVQAMLKNVQMLCTKEGFKVKQYDVVSGATTREYGDFADFIQLKFSSTGERSKALKYFDQKNYETAHDDLTCYYRIVCRDSRTSWTNWMVLKNYQVTKRHRFFQTVYTISLDYRNIRPFKGDIFADSSLRNDFTVEANFDIETYDSEIRDDVPRPGSATACMFKISLSFVTVDGELLPPGGDPADEKYTWAKPAGHLAYYDITTAATAAMPNRTVIQCRDMAEMIMAFGVIWNQMQPDYAPGFNSDNYDWVWIAEKARQYGLLEFLERNMSIANLAEYRRVEDKRFQNPATPFAVGSQTDKRSWGGYTWWKKYTFKISAELQNFPAACLSYPGYTCIDLLPQLRAALNNPDKYSLHFFLKYYQLGDKVDMPYKEMFRMYARNKRLMSRLEPLADMRWSTIEARAGEVDTSGELWRELRESAQDMKSVGEYCIVDGLRCHDLLVKTQFIRDRRQIGDLSYTTFDDCVYRANGMKVRNMINSKAVERNLHVSNRPPKKIETGKYPGAYVFPPKKGVASAKPSPVEMRASTDPKYQAWRTMPETEFNRVLAKIRECGVWLDDYKDTDFQQDGFDEHGTPCKIKGEWPACFIEWLALDTHYPIAGLDFSSLYPSLIMTYNFSPEMMVHTLERALELAAEGKQIHPVNFKFNGRDIKGWSVRSRYPARQAEIDEIFSKIQKLTKREDPDGTVEDALLDKVEKILQEVEFGLFPSVLKMLFDKRAAIKAELKPVNRRKEEIELMSPSEFAAHAEEYKLVIFRFNYLNSKQKALKVFMNTFYGEAGNSLSPLRVLALAGGVTSSGQYNIKHVAQLVQQLGCRIYYGDSVTGDTPVLMKEIQADGEPRVMLRTFNDIEKWCETQTEKQISEEWNQRYIWSANGWAKIESVVRHKTDKKIYRVSTHTGLVDVTEDHSLLDKDCNKIKPKDCIVGTQLKHDYPVYRVPDPQEYSIHNILEDEPTTRVECLAAIYGFFYGDGSCGKYGSGKTLKYSWALNNQDPEVVEKLLRYLSVAYPEGSFKQLDTLKSSGVYKIVPFGPIGIKKYVEEYRDKFYDGEKYKRVPDMIINASLPVKRWFMYGYYMADGAKTNGKKLGKSNTLFSNKGKIGTAGLYYLCKSLGYNCSVSGRSDKPDIFKVTCTFNDLRRPKTVIKKITELPSTDKYVYDVTTDDGTFGAGIGEIIVHNTDSVYISMPRAAFSGYDQEYYSIPYSAWSEESKTHYYEALVTESFRQIKLINKSVNDALEADNGTRFLTMAFEEFLFPAAFFSKKKYCGIAHEGSFNANPKHIFVRGLEYVKKGVSEMLKDMSMDILWRVFSTGNIESIFKIVEDKIQEVYTQKNLEFEKFVKTAVYKPAKQNISVHTFYKRMLALGMAPEPLDRFRYVIVKKYPFKYDVKGRKTPLSIGDQMEYADRAKALNMEINLDYYMSSGVCGQLARFISYDERFHVEPRDDSDESYNEAETKNINAAKKYILNCYERWSQKHQSKGPALRNLFKKVNGVFHDEFSRILKVSDLWQFDNQVKPVKGSAEKDSSQMSYEANQNMFQNIIARVEKQAAVESKREAERILQRLDITGVEGWVAKRNVYKSLLADRQRAFQRQMPALYNTLRAKTNILRKLFTKRDCILESCIAGLQSRVGIDTESFDTLEPILAKIDGMNCDDIRVILARDIRKNVTHNDLLVLNEIDGIYLRMLTLHKFVRVTSILVDELNSFLHYKLGDHTKIATNNHLDDLDDWMSENLI